MTLSMHKAAAISTVSTLKALSGVLEKAEAAVKAGQFSEAELMEARLAPDMFALPRQVQIGCDLARAMVRLTGREPESWPDEETTLAALRQRIARTVDYLEAIPAAEVDGSEDRPIHLSFRGGEVTMDFTGQQYLLRFVLPNVYFHATTAYDILRMKGLEIGKRDFIGGA
jgi:hypothetical protein